MIRIVPLLAALVLIAAPAIAERVTIAPGEGMLAAALAAAGEGDEIILSPGRYDGPVTIDKSLTLTGQAGAVIDAHGTGSVVLVDAPDATVRGLHLTGSGRVHEPIDAGVKLTRRAHGARILDNVLTGNLVGIDVHGARNALVEGNRIQGLRLARMNDRGNGIYIWNAPGTEVIGNEVRYGRDGIFSNVSKRNVFRGNLFRDLRFAVHYMYTNDSVIEDNISIGNHLGFALMYSDRITAKNNISINDRDHGVMLNYTNQSDIFANFVTGGTGKCAFVYNSHRNIIAENNFVGCEIGVHFTAGSERNTITGNAFVGNRTQVKYVGTSDVEWSHEGRGNYWSDHPAFDLDGDARADSAYRPNDLMDHILWSQPAAKLLLGSPAVQLVRWSQSQFPAARTGGVVDSHPLTTAPVREVPDTIERMAQATPLWAQGESYDDTDPLEAH
ncbi:nitrous oxide reductase family maturation protein NosD [Thalassovita aquimarina]|uniref:Nitrous oxide reductase family maturation protein NosD n=1 Tax=Thalassovita aquimarina TaxID=2785917 RepID=A0ABS5HR33_9RHOB|nr:nitrous oxide reductase family maturation protein NosD [Thalassovita aquimarina]MBR9651395.1 nitrous oxide reductase family maturation protein NosD [Thalassovita aquimarina]